MLGRKGVSLPVNMLVILAISIIVLLAIVAFFMGAFNPRPISEQAQKNSCCSEYVQNGCCGAGGFSNCNDASDTITVRGKEITCSNEVPAPDTTCCYNVTG